MITNEKLVPTEVANETNKEKSQKHVTTTPLGLSGKAIIIQVVISFVANLSSISIGMGYAFPTVTFDALTNPNSTMSISIEQASWYASVNAIAIPIGCIISSYVLDWLGRKRTFFMINTLLLISWIVVATASETNPSVMFAQLIVGRVLVGLCTGLSSSPACVYCSEISYKTLRGRLLVIPAFCISSGTVVMYLLGYFLSDDWRFISMIACAVSFVSIVVLIFMPETPSWLASKGRLRESEKALRTLRGLSRKGPLANAELQLELECLRDKSAALTGDQAERTIDKFRKPEVYRPFAIMLGCFAFQQLSGIFVVIVYAVQLSKAAGVGINPFLCAVGIGTARAIAHLLIGFIMDAFGQRRPAMFSSFTMSLCMFGIAAYVHSATTAYSWLPSLLVIGFLFMSTLGLLTMPFTMVSEVYPQNVRGFAAGLSTSFGFVLCFVVVKLYPTMVNTIGDVAVFSFYGCVAMISVVYLYFYMPETRGKTLEEIEQMFKGVAPAPNVLPLKDRQDGEKVNV